MKRLMALVLVVLVLSSVLVISGCEISVNFNNGATEATLAETKAVTEATKETEMNIGGNTANPMHEYDSLEDLAKAFGYDIEGDDYIPSLNELKFFIIDGENPIANIQFTYKGELYDYRMSTSTDDISGVYVSQDGEIVTLGQIATKDQKPMVLANGGYYARFFEDGVQYSLYSANAKEKDFTEVYESIE